MAEREHAFLHTLKRTARGGSLSSPQAKRLRQADTCAPVAFGLFQIAFILPSNHLIPIWFLVLVVGVSAADATCASRFLVALTSLCPRNMGAASRG
ncbi:MAG: hypothetical protein ACE5K9_01060 [Candidatus Methylomirabilales bacterium]